MDCIKTKEMIPIYMDQMLEEDEMQQVADHLLVCVDCKELHSDLSQITKALSEISTVAIPSSFHFEIPREDSFQEINNIGASRKNLRGKLGGFNWRIISVVASVFILSIALSSGIIDMGTIQPEGSGDMASMARIETYNLEIPWEEVKTLEEEEVYYINQLESQYDNEVQIEESYKDEAGIWYFTIKVEESLYKYEGKGGEIWIEK